MVQRCVNKVTEIAWAKFVKAEMFKSAIKTNGVYDTFAFYEGRILNDNTQLLQLNYMQVTDEEIADISEYDYKVIYFTDADCFGDAKHIGEQYYDATVNKIKEDLVKDKNAIWSTISVNEFGSGDERRFEIKYKRANVDDKKSSETDRMPTESNNKEYIDMSDVIMRDGTIYNVSDLVTYDKECLYFPVAFGTTDSSSVVRLKIPLKTLKEALDQLE